MKTLKKRRNPLGGGEDRSWRRKRGKETTRNIESHCRRSKLVFLPFLFFFSLFSFVAREGGHREQEI